jgi:transcriptional regulator with XRE-family HTH domain
MRAGSTGEGRLREIGQRIDRLRQAHRMTYEQLARKAGYDERTVRNIVHGQPCRPLTLRAVCEAVGLTNVDANVETVEFSDENHGAYNERQMGKYCGLYKLYRNSHVNLDTILPSQLMVCWSSDEACLVFTEFQWSLDKSGRKIAHSQSGEIYMNDASGLLHFLTISKGMVKLMTLTQLQLPEMVMKGGVFAQARIAFYQRPAIGPVLLRKVSDQVLPQRELAPLLEEITPSHPEYNEIAEEFQAIEREVLLSTFGAGRLKVESHGTALDLTVTKLSKTR